MGELQKVCVEKFIFCQALVQSSQDLYKFGPATKELKNILFISTVYEDWCIGLLHIRSILVYITDTQGLFELPLARLLSQLIILK